MKNKKILSTLIVTCLSGGAVGSTSGGAVSKLFIADGSDKLGGSGKTQEGGDGSDKLGGAGLLDNSGGDGQPKFGGTVSSLFSGGCTNGGGVG